MKKTLTRLACQLFPRRLTRFAYDQLTNPQVRKLRTHEESTLNKATKVPFMFQGFTIQCYTWEGGEKSVLLIHGWEGQAGNFSEIIEALIKRGFTVYGFDAPSHGYSSKGRTSPFQFTELVIALLKKFEVKNLISHSFGGVATTYALYKNQDIAIDNYLLFTVPDKFSERIDDVCGMTGITNAVKQRLILKLQRETGTDVNALSVSEFVKHINVKQALILHDKNDTVTPIERARNVHQHWKASTLLEVEGTGHFRILRTDSVIAQGVAFLSN